MSRLAPRIVFATTDVAADYGQLILSDTTTTARFHVLPRPSIGLAPIWFKKTKDNFRNVTITRSGSALIDGAVTLVLSNFNEAVCLVPTGTNWVVRDSAAGTSPTPTVPGAPTIGVAVGGVNAADVAFSAPMDDGGSAITGYTATSSPGGITGTGASSPITVSGLTAGQPYTFTVHATNTVGDSSESAASNSVTPSGAATAPGAPTIGTATAGNTTATANWTAPGSNGGSAITGYEVKTYRASDDVLLATDTTGVVLTFTKTGLTNGIGVYFKVAAINAIGTGTQSAASNTVTPATVFDPTDFSGMQLYAKPAGSMWQDSAETTPATADTALVGAWDDSSAGAHDLLQAVSGSRPMLKLSILNGLRGVRFLGKSLRSTFTLVQPYTLFLVAKSQAGAGNQYFADGVTLNTIALSAPDDGTMRVYAGAVLDVAPCNPRTYNIIILKANGASSRLIVGAANAAGDIGAANPGGITIGMGGDLSTGQLQGDVVFAGVYDSALSDANINSLGDFLAAQTALPFTHI